VAAIYVRRSHLNNQSVSLEMEYARDLSVMLQVTEPMTTALAARQPSSDPVHQETMRTCSGSVSCDIKTCFSNMACIYFGRGTK
jgi:hypothetical protein